MAAAGSVRRASKAQGTPLAETLLVIGVSAAGFAAVHAVQGVFGIAREIFGNTPTGDGTTPSGGRKSSSAAAGSRSGAHQAAGVVLIAGAAYVAMLLHRLLADLWDAVRDVGGSRPAQRAHKAAKAGESTASFGGPWAARRQSGDGHRHVRKQVRSGPDRAALPS